MAHDLLKDSGAISSADAFSNGDGSCPRTVKHRHGTKLLPRFPQWRLDGKRLTVWPGR